MSARNGSLEIPAYFLKAKQGYTVTKLGKFKWIYCSYIYIYIYIYVYIYIHACMYEIQEQKEVLVLVLMFWYAIPAHTSPFRVLATVQFD
jgi:hypothetical protein